MRLSSRLYQAGLFAALLFATSLAHATAEESIAGVIARDAPPSGIVFEIVTGEEGALERGLPRVRDLAVQLRAKYPDLPVAVVTHGSEQFALLTSEQGRSAATHRAVKSLLAADVPVQVCATHASWRDKAPEDFPEYVGIAASAGSQLNDYRALGYEVVRLRP